MQSKEKVSEALVPASEGVMRGPGVPLPGDVSK